MISIVINCIRCLQLAAKAYRTKASNYIETMIVKEMPSPRRSARVRVAALRASASRGGLHFRDIALATIFKFHREFGRRPAWLDRADQLKVHSTRRIRVPAQHSSFASAIPPETFISLRLDPIALGWIIHQTRSLRWSTGLRCNVVQRSSQRALSALCLCATLLRDARYNFHRFSSELVFKISLVAAISSFATRRYACQFNAPHCLTRQTLYTCHVSSYEQLYKLHTIELPQLRRLPHCDERVACDFLSHSGSRSLGALRSRPALLPGRAASNRARGSRSARAGSSSRATVCSQFAIPKAPARFPNTHIRHTLCLFTLLRLIYCPQSFTDTICCFISQRPISINYCVLFCFAHERAMPALYLRVNKIFDRPAVPGAASLLPSTTGKYRRAAKNNGNSSASILRQAPRANGNSCARTRQVHSARHSKKKTKQKIPRRYTFLRAQPAPTECSICRRSELRLRRLRVWAYCDTRPEDDEISRRLLLMLLLCCRSQRQAARETERENGKRSNVFILPRLCAPSGRAEINH
ncbi:unnamed protein product [Trichogramma brassicae]|uniref:Uncharacterized protein n=1 Tax=Trichogramma brassicae TaxID=86971 RepID=A0A6H5ITZ7_9HYME|nr:unnamed protein product [Trichogramma brassicae]